MTSPWRVALGLWAPSMILTAVAEANGWDKTAAIASVIGAAGVLSTIGYGLYQRLTRGKRVIVFSPSLDFTPRRTGGGIKTMVTWDLDLPMGVPERTNARAWFRDGRFQYPMKRTRLENSPLRAHRQVAEFELAPEFMPPIGKEVEFRCRVSLVKGGGSNTLRDFVTFFVAESQD